MYLPAFSFAFLCSFALVSCLARYFTEGHLSVGVYTNVDTVGTSFSQQSIKDRRSGQGISWSCCTLTHGWSFSTRIVWHRRYIGSRLENSSRGLDNNIGLIMSMYSTCLTFTATPSKLGTIMLVDISNLYPAPLFMSVGKYVVFVFCVDQCSSRFYLFILPKWVVYIVVCPQSSFKLDIVHLR